MVVLLFQNQSTYVGLITSLNSKLFKQLLPFFIFAGSSVNNFYIDALGYRESVNLTVEENLSCQMRDPLSVTQ